MARQFRRPFDDHDPHVETFREKSIVMPDQALTVAQILEASIVSGEMPYVNRYPEVYDPEGSDDDWYVTSFDGDLTDIDTLKQLEDYEKAKENHRMDSKDLPVDTSDRGSIQEEVKE